MARNIIMYNSIPLPGIDWLDEKHQGRSLYLAPIKTCVIASKRTCRNVYVYTQSATDIPCSRHVMYTLV